MTAPGFVVVGHVVKDVLADGWRLGGTSTFAAVQAQRLGLHAGIVTRVGASLDLEADLPGVALAGRPSSSTTCFENVYEDGNRRQRVLEQADEIEASDVPKEWQRAPVVLLGPVCGEAAPDLSTLFGGSLAGLRQ